MPENKKKWGCAPGENLQHFFIPISDFYVPCCDKGGTVEHEIISGGNKAKCKVCVINEKGC